MVFEKCTKLLQGIRFIAQMKTKEFFLLMIACWGSLWIIVIQNSILDGNFLWTNWVKWNLDGLIRKKFLVGCDDVCRDGVGGGYLALVNFLVVI